MFENLTEQEIAFLCFDSLTSERDNNSVISFTHQFLTICDNTIQFLETKIKEHYRLIEREVPSFSTLENYLSIVQDLRYILSKIIDSNTLKSVLPEVKVESLRTMVIIENLKLIGLSIEYKKILKDSISGKKLRDSAEKRGMESRVRKLSNAKKASEMVEKYTTVNCNKSQAVKKTAEELQKHKSAIWGYLALHKKTTLIRGDLE